MDALGYLLAAIPAFPLVAAILLAILGPWLRGARREDAGKLTVGAFAAALACSLLALLMFQAEESASESKDHGFERVYTLWTWATAEADYEPLADREAPVELQRATLAPRDFRIDVSLRIDSLTAVELHIWVESDLNVDLAVEQLFTAPSIRELAVSVDQLLGDSRPAVTESDRDDAMDVQQQWLVCPQPRPSL